jgi:tetratricopeptide (TPR) repeat protein
VTVIEIAERFRAEDGSFAVRVSFRDGGEYDAVVSDPADAVREQRLAWYFEEHLRYPFLDREVAARAVAELGEYGRDLFGQVFAGAALAEYRSWAVQAFDGCRLQVQGSAAFHRLHWEALLDPEGASPLAVRLPITRRVEGLGTRFTVAAAGDVLNILVVTARPDGPSDVGYRTISRPLLEGLRRADRPVRVELVRPGTWEALRDRLRAASAEHGSGFFHVVHFDLHGAVADYSALERGRQAQRFLFGQGVVEEFAGERGFLFFETGTTGKARPVSAGEVADLLSEHRVPVAVLNACQSAKESTSEASLAQRLVDAGVPVTVGMAYSVTVSAAQQAMPILYEELSRGRTPVEASHAARRSLFDVKTREGYFDQQLELEDWALPVVFAQRPLRIDLSEMTPARQAAYYTDLAEVGDEPRPEYGFVGRDLDIHALERALVSDPDRNEVLVQGMAGAGKSTLLEHVRWWWRRTGLVEKAFSYSYEERAWNATHLLRDITEALEGKIALARLDAMPVQAQIEQVAGWLRARRCLLVLDNIESITASPAAIPHSLTDDERQVLARFLSRLRGGRTLVVFGSREPEAWLAPDTFGENVYRLPGLDPEAASTLTHRILARHHATGHERDETQRQALLDLTKLLGGYPLPLTVVLPALATRKPSEVLADLREGTPEGDPVGLIRKAIEYSHGKLDPHTRNSLLLLAPFTASIPTGPLLKPYLEALSGQEAVTALGPVDLDTAIREAIRVGLGEPSTQLTGFVRILPVLPYFLRTRLPGHPGLGEALREAHYRLYSQLGPAIQAMLTSSDPEQRPLGHALARVEYANLTSAITYALAHQHPVLPVLRAVEEFLDQTKQQPARRLLLEQALAAVRDPQRTDLNTELADLHHLTGMVAQDQRRFQDAEENYRQALTLYLEFNDRHSAANIYHQLGTVAQQQRRFEDAEENYRQALTLFLEFNDRYGTADVHHQLGIVAQQQRRFEDAEENYRQALTLSLEFHDRHGAASTYHQLGRVAQEQRRFEDAEENYRQALTLKLEFNDRHGAAGTYHQLGMVAQDQRRFADAEENYRQALTLKLEFNDRHSAASTYHQLGRVAQDQRRFQDAEENYRQALTLSLEFNDRHGAAITYHQLGIVAQEQQRPTDALTSFVQAAVSWHTSVGGWPSETLTAIKRLSREIGDDGYRSISQEVVPADLLDDFISAIEAGPDEG